MASHSTVTKTTVVPINIEAVWQLITTTNKFHGLGLPGSWDTQFDRDIAKPGTQIKASGLMGDTMNVVICEWSPPHLFSFGNSVADWTFMYRLKKLDNSSTEIAYSRAFRKLSWIERVFTPKHKKDNDELTSRTLSEISHACHNLAKGEEDGVWTE